MSDSFAFVVAAKRLLVFVGEGGVGKTSCAAATALAAARSGRHVAVLTVDPAPRLGDALGLDAIDDLARPVQQPGCRGSLVAMRLDTKRTFDRVVEALAPGTEVAARILANPIYQAIAGSLGGSDSYMAFQKLHELVESGAYDLVIVDTPPTAHAEDLLAAPARLATLIESGAPAVLVDPALVIARAGSQIAKATLAVILAMLERVSGSALRTQVAEFTGGFEAVLDGLRARAAEVDAMLKESATTFVHVVRPAADRVDAALEFRRYLLDHGLPVGALILNRMSPAAGADRDVPLVQRMNGAPAGTLAAVASIEHDLEAMRASEAKAADVLDQALAEGADGSPCVVIRTTSLEHDVAGIAELIELGRRLGLG